jgi:hypothetical protein
MKSLTVKIDDATFKHLQGSATRDGITITDAVRDALESWITGEEEALMLGQPGQSRRGRDLYRWGCGKTGQALRVAIGRMA